MEKPKGPPSTTSPASSTRGRKLGTWKVKRVGDNQILITIPNGMTLKGKELVIEDVIAAASNYLVVRKGRVLACCSGNVAIA